MSIEKEKPKEVLMSTSASTKKTKEKLKEHERPATTTPPSSKRKKLDQDFVTDTISSVKKTKAKNFSSSIKEPRLSSSLVCKFSFFIFYD